MGVQALDRTVELLQQHTLDAKGLTNSDIDTIEGQLRSESSEGVISNDAQSLLDDVRHKVIDGPGYFTTDNMKYFTKTYGLSNDQLRGWNVSWLQTFADNITGPIDSFQSDDTREDLINTAVRMSYGETSTTLLNELTEIVTDQDPILTRPALHALCQLYSDTDGRYGQKAIGQQLLNHSDVEVRRTVLQVLKNEFPLTGIPEADVRTAFNNPDNGPVMQYNLASLAIKAGTATDRACEELAAIANGSAFPYAYYAKAKEHGPEDKIKLQTAALKLLQEAPGDDLAAVLPDIEALLRHDDTTMRLAAILTIAENYSPTGFDILFNLIQGAEQPREIQVAAFQGLDHMLHDISIRDDVDLGPDGPAQEIRNIFKNNLDHANLDVQLACIVGLSTVDQVMGWSDPEQITRDAIHAVLTADFQTFSDYKKILATLETIYPQSGDFKSYLVDMMDYKLNTSPNSDWEIATLKALPIASDNAKTAQIMIDFAKNSPNIDSVKVALVCLKDVIDSADTIAKKKLAPAVGQFAKLVLAGKLPCLEGATERQKLALADLAKRLLA